MNSKIQLGWPCHGLWDRRQATVSQVGVYELEKRYPVRAQSEFMVQQTGYKNFGFEISYL